MPCRFDAIAERPVSCRSDRTDACTEETEIGEPDPPLRVLHVEPDAAEADRVASALPRAFVVVRAEDAGAAALRLGTERFDAILERLAGEEPDALAGFARVQATAQGVPLVVVVAKAHEALALKAVQLGAQDYLVDEQMHPTLLARCLRYAIESSRLRGELERRPSWSEEPEARRTTVTGRLYGAAPLNESLPAEFAALVAAYGEALDLALDQRIYRIEHPIRQRLREVANRIGFLRGGARDVVDVHAAALRARRNEPAPRYSALVDESRLLLLELMGHLVTYYRRYSLGAAGGPGIRVRTGEPAPENGGAGDG